MSKHIESGHEVHSVDTFIQASWFGLVCGLIDGILQVVFQHFRWINWGGTFFFWVSREILWASPVVYFLLFNLIGAGLIVLRRLSGRLWPEGLPFYVFSFLTAYDWLMFAAAGHLKRYALLLLAAAFTVAINRGSSVRCPKPSSRQVLGLIATVIVVFVLTVASGMLEESNAAQSLPAAGSQKPNVVVIIVDALRADHLSSYGYSRSTSPHLDRIASGGVLLENALATSSWTLPSHTSLLTGRYPREHGAQEFTDVYDGRYPTLAEFLRMRGYRTGAFSSNTTFFSRAVGLGRGFIHFEDAFTNIGNTWVRTGYGREVYRALRYGGLLESSFVQDLTGLKRADAVVSSILDWVDRDSEKPFLVVANVADTHGPYVPPEPFLSRFAGAAGGDRAVTLDGDKPGQVTRRQQDIDAYDGAISYVDEQLGNLFAQLQARNPNTIFVVTSDHGEAFGKHGFFMHDRFLFRELIRVPLFFSWPGHLPAGVRVPQPVTCAAVAATLVELLGLEGQVFPGPSLSKLWNDPGLQPSWPYPESELRATSRSSVNGKWHYIEEPQKLELYNWESDPDEMRNIADTPEGRRIVEDFRAYISRARARE